MDTLEIGKRKYSKEASKDISVLFVVMIVILVAVYTVILGISFFVNWNSNNELYSENRKGEYSRQFFTAVRSGNSEHIQNNELKAFYRDLVEADGFLEEGGPFSGNPLVTTSLDEIFVSRDTYPSMCKYFFEFAQQGGKAGCVSYGYISSTFLQEYYLAQTGQSQWLTWKPVAFDGDFDGALGMGLKTYSLFAWGVLQVFLSIGLLIWYGSGPWSSDYRRHHEARPLWSRQALLWTPVWLSFPIYYRVAMRPVRKHKKQQREALDRKRYKYEILQLAADIAHLENLHSSLKTPDIKRNLRHLQSVLKDLMNEDTELERQTIEWLSEEYVRNANEAKEKLEAFRLARTDMKDY